MGIPVVSVVDTNANPDGVDYVIPGNDDAIRAVRLYLSAAADAILDGKQSVSIGEQSSSDEFIEEAGREAEVDAE